MMKNRAVALLMIAGLLMAAAASAQEASQERIRELLREGVNALRRDGDERLVVSFNTFTYADKDIGSRFSSYLEDQLSLILADHEGFEVFEREKLEEILETLELSLSDLVDPETAVPVGNLKGVEALLSGRFFDAEDAVLVYLDLTGVETGTTIGKAEVVLPRSAVPAGIAVMPDNYNDALFVLEELSEVVGADDTDFVVKVWTKRGNGGTYYEGEDLVIHFYSNRDCYIKIYHIDVSKNVSLIFPNPHYTNNFIKGRQLQTIPDIHYGFTFELGPPFGAEFVKVVASTVQFEDVEEAFKGLGSTSRELVQRGLSLKKKEQQVTESLISYTILSR